MRVAICAMPDLSDLWDEADKKMEKLERNSGRVD